MRPLRVLVVSLLAFSGSAAVLFSSSNAQAGTTCAQDSECVKGFTCQPAGTTGCPAIDCAPNQPCPAPPACTPMVTKECLPGPCNVDSDCAAGMVCFAQTQTSCPTQAVPCPAGADCPAPAPDAGACVTSTVKSCVPRYVLPCKVASDCGGGFSCTPDQQCWCNGGMATPPGDAGTASFGSGGGSAPPSSPSPAPGDDSGVSPPNCGCTALDTSHCQAQMITCSAASDCPAMWSCVQPPTVSFGCASAQSTDGAAAPPCVPPTPAPMPSLCEPPYYDLTSGGSFGAGGTSASAPSPDANSKLAADGGGGGGASNGAASKNLASGGGGCQLGSGPAGAGGAGWLALLGLVGLARRRRSPAA
jgi:MYXO-CTERM domain-containing protein